VTIVSGSRPPAARLYRERGAGNQPTIVIGGFVPDATEVVEFQRPLLKQSGALYYLNYPREGFHLPLFQAQLADLVESLNLRGERPVLLGVSFGAGLVAGFLRDVLPLDGLAIRGALFVSPVFCAEDLVRPDRERTGGVRMLESNLRRILSARHDSPEEVERQIERARRCFQGLFGLGAENRALDRRHLAIRDKIMAVINRTPARGGFERTLAIQEFRQPSPDGPLFSGPVLTLLAEAEESLLVPTSPTLALCREPRQYHRVFPGGRCLTVTSRKADDPVAHASLIFHHQAYNPVISAWYRRFSAPSLLAAV
jgi:predicted alpha/beta hydrolase family esterase